MVIISSNPLARNQLLTKGKVYTFRKGKLRKKSGIDGHPLCEENLR